MEPRPYVYDKPKFLAMLRRLGHAPEAVAELDRVLGDEVDVRRDEDLLARHGVYRNGLTDRMGGSP